MLKINGRIAAAVSVLAVSASVIGISLLGGGAATAATAPLPAPNSITGDMVKNGTLKGVDLDPAVVKWFTAGPYNNSVTGSTVKDGTLGEADLDPALKAKVNNLPAKGDKGDKGDRGPAGPGGADAILSVTADTMVTGRPDTATDGAVWANDDMTRTLTVVRQHATKASDCGAGAVKCWYYTGTIRDNGTFTTVAGAHGPNSATPISGIVEGTVNGVYEIEFNASSDKPNPSLVDSTVSGASPSTSNWMKLAFPAGTQFAGFTGVDYSWIYKAPKTCEVHTQTTAANTGDILGANACTP